MKTGHNSQWLKLTEEENLIVNIFSGDMLSSTNSFSDQSNDWSMKSCLHTVSCHQWNHLPLLTNTWGDLLPAGDAFSMIKSSLKVTRRLKMFHGLDLSAVFFNVIIPWLFLLSSVIIQILSYHQNECNNFTFLFQNPFDVFK